MKKIKKIHYVIRDDNKHIIAIHSVYDSAVACFDALVRSNRQDEMFHLISLHTNQYGVVETEEVVKTSAGLVLVMDQI